MTDLRQAAQQALEALEDLDGLDTETECVTIDVGDVIAALRTALEQQAEPVAVERWLWIFEDRHGDRYTHKNLFYTADEAAESARICGVKAVKKIDSSKVMQQAEPVLLEAVYETIINWDEGGGKRSRRELAKRIVDLYTTPPQRPWVGLTDEDFLEACQIAERGNYLLALQRIQIKLMEKNSD